MAGSSASWVRTDAMATESFIDYCNRLRYGIDDNSDESVRQNCQGLKFKSKLNELPYEKFGVVLPRNQLGKCTQWELADFIPGIVARRLEFARSIKSFSATVVSSDIGVHQAIDELGGLMASQRLATSWNDHPRLLVLHCHKVAPGVFGADELACINSWYERNQDGISRYVKPHLRCQ